MTIIDADKLDEIIVDAINASTNKVECQTLRWVLDKISELSSVTPQEQEPCEDVISRAELLEELGEEPFNWNDSPEAIQEVRDYQWFRSLVENALPVTSKQTSWISISEKLPKKSGREMTNERAKEVLQEQIDRYGRGYIEEGIKALHRAIEVLGQQSCEDCISRQAAIDAIAKLHPVDTEYDCTLYDKLDVRYVLMNLPSVTPTVSKMKQDEDHISREAVKQLICQNNDKYGYSDRFHEFTQKCLQLPLVTSQLQPCEDCVSREAVIDLVADYDLNMDQVVKGIHALQPVTLQPKIGHWEDCSNGWICSNCYRDVSHEYDFCPHCGADMRGIEEKN